MSKEKLRGWIKKAGRPVMSEVFEFLMRQARSHKGRRLFGPEELKLVREALLSQNLFAIDGYMVVQFEQEFALAYGVPYAVASTSGTAAIHTAIGALDLDPGSEIITAPITDLGTVIPILYQNCIPVFADVDDSYNMDPKDVEKRITPRTKAIVAVHLFGNPCDMDAMLDVARRHKLPLIEDCAQAHMTEYKGRYVGTLGDLGCFSFQQAKHMTTGDGGMTITSNKAHHERMKLFVDKGYARKGWGSRAYLFHAPNYRMNELTGAVGRAQLKKVKGVVDRRRELGDHLTSLVAKLPGVIPAPVTAGAKSSYWLYPLRVPGVDVQAFAKEMKNHGISASPGYTGKPIYLCAESLTQKRAYGRSSWPFDAHAGVTYDYAPGLCPRAEKLLGELVCIPLNESWTHADVEKAAAAVRKGLDRAGVRGGVPVPSAAPEPPVSAAGPKGRTRVAIIGCGAIGKWHVEAYRVNPEAELGAFVDTDLERAEHFAREHGGRAYATHRDLLAAWRPDAASLCTVPATHHEITLDLLNAGVSVLCEKPLAMNPAQAEEMTRRAREKNLVLLTAFKLRFAQEVLRTKELLGEKRLGDIVSFRLFFGGYMDMSASWHSKKEISGGGVLMDNGPHALDLVRYLFGDIEALRTRTWDRSRMGVEDTVRVEVVNSEGVPGMLDMSWLAPAPSKSYLEIFGTEGSAFLDTEGLAYKLRTWADWKRLPSEDGQRAAFAAQIAHFLGAVRGKGTTIVDAAAGFETQRLLDEVYKKENR